LCIWKNFLVKHENVYFFKLIILYSYFLIRSYLELINLNNTYIEGILQPEIRQYAIAYNWKQAFRILQF
jgi:hypothetical protein